MATTSTKRKQDESTGIAGSSASSNGASEVLSSSSSAADSLSTKSDREYVEDILARCKRELDGYQPILDCTNRYDRYTVVICNPELIDLYLDPDAWKRSKLNTLYLLSDSDEVLQKAIGTVVKRCGGKLFLRLFSRQVPLPEYEHLPFGGWIHVIMPDDRSPPARRILVMAFKLGDMSIEQRDEFLSGARHEFADLIMIERIPEESNKQGLTLKEWASLMRTHSGMPNEKAAMYSSDGKSFMMVVRFFQQGEPEGRQFVRKDESSDGTARLF